MVRVETLEQRRRRRAEGHGGYVGLVIMDQSARRRLETKVGDARRRAERLARCEEAASRVEAYLEKSGSRRVAFTEIRFGRETLVPATIGRYSKTNGNFGLRERDKPKGRPINAVRLAEKLGV